MQYTIDRFEDGGWAVLEDDQQRRMTVPRSWLPITAREGDVVVASEDNPSPTVKNLRLEVDTAARVIRLEDARQLRDRLPRGPKGDVSL
jgi:DUF3006 family protein